MGGEDWEAWIDAHDGNGAAGLSDQRLVYGNVRFYSTVGILFRYLF